jgi:hypothetical protein
LQENAKNNENDLETYNNDDNLYTNFDLNSSCNPLNSQPILYNIPYYTNTNTLSIPSQPTFYSINTIPNNNYSSFNIPQDQSVYNYSSIPNGFDQFTYNNHIVTSANSNSFNQTPSNNNMFSQEHFQ